MTSPKNIKELRASLGLFNFFRRLVCGYSKITSVFHDLLTKNDDYIWRDQHEAAFQQFKLRMLSGPILSFYDASKPLLVISDSSLFSIGYVIVQEWENKQFHIIASGARSLSPTERKRSITHLECLAVVVAVSENHSLQANKFFTVYTDHFSLAFLQNLSNFNSRIHRYVCLFLGYRYEILYKKGSENISNIISRLDYANQLKPSNNSVAKFNKNVPKIDYVIESKTNHTISSEQLQSSLVQDTLSASVLLPPKLDSQALDTGANYNSAEHSLKENLLPLMSDNYKPINSGTPVSSPDVTGVTLESTDYIIPINFEAVLNESLYSDTVYAAESPVYAVESATSEGIHNDNFSESETDDAGWTPSYRFVYSTDSDTERKSDFSENNYVGAGTRFPSTDSPKILINKPTPKINCFFQKVILSQSVRSSHPLSKF